MKKKAKSTLLLKTIVFARILLPLLIFTHPIVTLVILTILDAVDGQIFYELGYPWSTYNLVDKLLDYWWYIFIVIFFHGSAVFGIVLALFALRTIGQVLGIILKKEKIFIFFPNMIEAFFLITLLAPHLNSLISVLISLVWALCIEWGVHYSNFHLYSKYLFRHEIVWKKNRK